MPTVPGDIDDDQLMQEAADIKNAEVLNNQVMAPPPPPPELEERHPASEPVEPEPIVDERLSRLEAISRKNRGIDAPMEPQPQQEPVVRQEPVVQHETVVDEAPDELPVWRSDEGVLKARLKINGSEVERDYDDVIADAQKVSAADERFRAAAAIAKENEMLKAQLAQSRTQLPHDVGVSGLPHDVQQGITSETLNQAVLDGDEQAQQRLLSRLNQPPLNEAQIAANIKQQIEVDLAIEKVSNADTVYKDILNDDIYRDIADRFSQQFAMEEPHLTAAENITKALEQAAKKLNLRQAPLSTRTTSKKQHAQSNLQSVGSTRTPLAEEHIPQTAEMARAQMRKLRMG